MKGNLFLLLISISVSVPLSAFAEQDVDMRLKFGSAAHVDRFTVDNVGYNSAGSSSGNLQFEVIVNQREEGPVGFLFGGGFFLRRHSGSDHAPVQPTDVDYNAAGLNFTAGAGIRAGDALHFEGKLELGFGSGKPDFTRPGFAWPETEPGNYRSSTLILGSYYTFMKPGFQIGLELGYQSFSGNFRIWNSATGWSSDTVRGSSGTANIVFGYRF